MLCRSFFFSENKILDIVGFVFFSKDKLLRFYSVRVFFQVAKYSDLDPFESTHFGRFLQDHVESRVKLGE